MCPKARLIPAPDRHSWQGQQERLLEAAAPLLHSVACPQLPHALFTQAWWLAKPIAGLTLKMSASTGRFLLTHVDGLDSASMAATDQLGDRRPTAQTA